MSDSISVLVLTGFTLGLAYAAVPGPINTETIRRGLSLGFRPAFQIQIGALIGDTFWAVLGLSGAVVLSGTGRISTILELVGGVFLAILAMNALASSRSRDRSVPTGAGTGGRHLAVGAIFSLANPVGLAFWAGLGSGLIARLGEPTTSDLRVVMGSFLVAVVVWAIALSSVVALGRRPSTARLLPVVDGACGVVLGWFAVTLLWSSLGRIVS